MDAGGTMQERLLFFASIAQGSMGKMTRYLRTYVLLPVTDALHIRTRMIPVPGQVRSTLNELEKCNGNSEHKYIKYIDKGVEGFRGDGWWVATTMPVKDEEKRTTKTTAIDKVPA